MGLPGYGLVLMFGSVASVWFCFIVACLLMFRVCLDC